MKNRKKIWIFNTSWLGIVNRLLLQWFFIRLTKCENKVVEEFKITSFDLMSDGGMSPIGSGKVIKYRWYSIQFWILPTTGWNKNFIYLSKKPRFIRITPKKVI